MGDSIVKYTFSSVYKFSRRGAQEIEASFSSTGPGRFAHCNYDQSRDTFKIECGRDSEEETIFSFLDIFTRYIDAETLDASVSRFNGILSTLVFLKARTNVQGALKVERVEATSLERPSLGWGTLEDSSEGSNDINEEPGEEVPCSTVWTPKSVQTGFLSKLSQWSIDSIEELTSCVLQVDADRTTIRISGSPTTAVDKALKKLDTLERKHYQEFQTTEFHLVEPEKEQGFALQFLSLRKAGNQMLRSTLLRLDSPQISELHKRVVVRTLVYDESRRVWLPLKKKIESITAADGASQSFGIWEYFRFRSLGIDSDVFGHLAAHNTDFSSLFSSEDGGLGNENLPPAKAEQVRAWQRQVQNDNLEELAELPPTPSVLSTVKSSTSGKGEESSVMEELIDKLDPQATTASQHGSPPAIEELSPKKRMGKFRRPKVLGAAGVPGSEQEYGSLDQPVTPDQVSTYGNGPILGTAVSPNSAPEHNESHTAYQSAENIQSLEATKGQSGSNQEDLRVLMQQDVAPSLVLDSLRSPSKRNQPLVTPREETSVQPQTPEVLLDLSEPFMAHSNLPQAPSSDFEFPVTSETRALKAISLLDSVENPESFRYMPHLPALAPSASTPDLASMKVSELSSSRESDRLPQSQLGAVNDVLVGSDVAAQETSNDGGLAKDVTSAISIGSANSQKAARRKGRVDTARLKKLNEMGTSMLERARPFNGDIRLAVEIGRILLSGVSPQYTTSPFAETEWDNAFTGRGGSAIPRTTFTNMLTASFVDADFVRSLKMPGGGRMFQEQPHEFKVAYEFNCLTEGSQEITLEVDEFADYVVNKSIEVLASLYWHYPKRAWDAMLTLTGATRVTDFCEDATRTIVNNLQIPEQTLLDLRTKAPSKDLRVLTVLLRRETRYYAIAHPNIVLHLTEVQQLYMEQSDTDNLRAFAKPAAEMIKENRLWYEVSLSSKLATEKFNENLELELGENASWEPQELVDKGLMEDLRLVTAKLVTSIDGVGHANQGPGGGPSERAMGQTAAQAAAPQPAIGFW